MKTRFYIKIDCKIFFYHLFPKSFTFPTLGLPKVWETAAQGVCAICMRQREPSGKCQARPTCAHTTIPWLLGFPNVAVSIASFARLTLADVFH